MRREGGRLVALGGDWLVGIDFDGEHTAQPRACTARACRSTISGPSDPSGTTDWRPSSPANRMVTPATALRNRPTATPADRAPCPMRGADADLQRVGAARQAAAERQRAADRDRADRLGVLRRGADRGRRRRVERLAVAEQRGARREPFLALAAAVVDLEGVDDLAARLEDLDRRLAEHAVADGVGADGGRRPRRRAGRAGAAPPRRPSSRRPTARRGPCRPSARRRTARWCRSPSSGRPGRRRGSGSRPDP